MYIEEQKFKGFIPNKKVEAIVGKGIEEARNILINDVLQPTSLDNRWKVKSQNPTILTQWYCFRGNPFVEYACCSCEHALRGNFCKHQIAILLKFLPDCRESSILEYCGTYYGTQRGGLKALCLLSKPHEISDFEEELDEDTCEHTCREEEENSDTDDEQIEDTMASPTQEGVALNMKQLLEGIQEECFSGGMLLMQHTNAILERLHTDVRNLRRSNAIDSLYPNVHFEARTDITSKSIKRIRDHMEIYIERKQKRRRRTRGE